MSKPFNPPRDTMSLPQDMVALQPIELLRSAAALLEHARRLLPGMHDADLVKKRSDCGAAAEGLRAFASHLESTQTVSLTAFQRSAPERIWINVFGTEEEYPEGFPTNHADITWCQDPVGDLDIPYVRADVASHAMSRAEQEERADPCEPQESAHVPMPREPNAAILDALRTGSKRDWPSDEMCRVRYAALLAAATRK